MVIRICWYNGPYIQKPAKGDSGILRSASIYDRIDISLVVANLLYAAVSDCTLVGQLDAEFTFRETFFNLLQEMLNNFLKRMVTRCFFPPDLYALI